jgi:hypothetical protein
VKLTGPVEALTTTTLSSDVEPQEPVAVAVIVAFPKKAASQFTTPVAGSIVPAVAGASE